MSFSIDRSSQKGQAIPSPEEETIVFLTQQERKDKFTIVKAQQQVLDVLSKNSETKESKDFYQARSVFFHRKYELAKDDVHVSRQKVKELQEQTTQLIEENKGLKKDNAEKDETIATQDRSNQELCEDIVKLQGQINYFQKGLAKRADIIKKVNGENYQLRVELDTSEKEKSKLQSDLDTLDRENRDLSFRVAKMQKKNVPHPEYYPQKQEADLKFQVKHLMEENNYLRSTLQHRPQPNAELIQQLRTKIQELQEQNKQLVQESANQNSALVGMKRKYEEIALEASSTKESKDELVQKMKKIKTAVLSFEEAIKQNQ